MLYKNKTIRDLEAQVGKYRRIYFYAKCLLEYNKQWLIDGLKLPEDLVYTIENITRDIDWLEKEDPGYFSKYYDALEALASITQMEIECASPDDPPSWMVVGRALFEVTKNTDSLGLPQSFFEQYKDALEKEYKERSMRAYFHNDVMKLREFIKNSKENKNSETYDQDADRIIEELDPNKRYKNED